jgi:peptidoglycan/LPS O-acetylase OafA/YrhL
VDRRIIALIWVSGIVLMVVIYAIGPQHFITACEQFIAEAMWWLSDLIDMLTLRAFEVVRAVAIAMYVVFGVLAVMATRRRLHPGGMLLVVSVVFLLLVRTDWYDPGTKWLAAAVLTTVAAGVLTKRLIDAPRRRDPADPWGVGPRGGDNRSGPPRTPL